MLIKYTYTIPYILSQIISFNSNWELHVNMEFSNLFCSYFLICYEIKIINYKNYVQRRFSNDNKTFKNF